MKSQQAEVLSVATGTYQNEKFLNVLIRDVTFVSYNFALTLENAKRLRDDLNKIIKND